MCFMMLQCNLWSHNPFFDFVVFFFAALCLVGPLTYCASLQPCRYGPFLFAVPF